MCRRRHRLSGLDWRVKRLHSRVVHDRRELDSDAATRRYIDCGRGDAHTDIALGAVVDQGAASTTEGQRSIRRTGVQGHLDLRVGVVVIVEPVERPATSRVGRVETVSRRAEACCRCILKIPGHVTSPLCHWRLREVSLYYTLLQPY